MAGGYYLSFQEPGEEVGMLPLAYALCIFPTQKLDDQNIHFPAPQSPNNFSMPTPSAFQERSFVSWVREEMGLQRYFNISGNSTWMLQSTSRGNPKMKHKAL